MPWCTQINKRFGNLPAIAQITEDKSMLKKINELIRDFQRTPFEGKGKSEPLIYDLTGFWSRRIDSEHRLVYKVIDNDILIYSCKYHYDK